MHRGCGGTKWIKPPRNGLTQLSPPLIFDNTTQEWLRRKDLKEMHFSCPWYKHVHINSPWQQNDSSHHHPPAPPPSPLREQSYRLRCISPATYTYNTFLHVSEELMDLTRAPESARQAVEITKRTFRWSVAYGWKVLPLQVTFRKTLFHNENAITGSVSAQTCEVMECF